MQFHLNGFRPGDPGVFEPAEPLGEAQSCDKQPDEVDVLIIGCGPAGLTLAAQLAVFPGIRTRIVEEKTGRLLRGHADGISCRSLEMFQAFGFAERVKKEAYWVNETTFWRPDADQPKNIVRSGRIQDVEDGLSEMPHVILNQARVHDMYLDLMRNSPSRLEPDYAHRLVGLRMEQGGADYPLVATLERVDPLHAGQTETVRARYVVGCDGARSTVRKSIGCEFRGDSANQAWGVMDVLAVTDFPDIRMKTLIQSAREGNILIIPREGGYLVRLYIELDKLDQNERVNSRNITLDDLIATARKIFQPYTLEVQEVAWWSVYEIGQRLTDKFDDVPVGDVETVTPRVFIAGDACHTHSPKAGQGMNVSMGDSLNLGWKLAAVLQGCSPEQLLHTYSAERRAIAKELIDFDREWARIISARPQSPDVTAGENAEPPEFQKYFIQHGRYTAGTAIRYCPSIIIGEPTWQDLATGFEIGMRFHSAPVIRLADAKLMQLGHTVQADGRWRLFAFAGTEDPTDRSSGIYALCDFLESSLDSPVLNYTPEGKDMDSVIDVRAVFQQPHRELALADMPGFLLMQKGRYGLRDYEKMFCPDLKGRQDIYEMRGIDRQRGCVVIIRPDQYVAHVLPLDAYAGLTAFFGAFMRRRPVFA